MTEYEMNKLIGAKGSFYRVTKNGNPDKRYKFAKQLEQEQVGKEIYYRVSQSKRKDVQQIAETKKRARVQKIKKTSFLDKVTGFFKVLFILAIVIAIPLSYAIAER